VFVIVVTYWSNIFFKFKELIETIIWAQEKFRNLLNQMACVGLVVDDQEVVTQLFRALPPSHKTFLTIVGNMPTFPF
jgi:hypothetical protein